MDPTKRQVRDGEPERLPLYAQERDGSELYGPVEFQAGPPLLMAQAARRLEVAELVPMHIPARWGNCDAASRTSGNRPSRAILSSRSRKFGGLWGIFMAGLFQWMMRQLLISC
jgi:hypothetical protein